MDYLIAITDQLTRHLRSLRKMRGLSQTDLARKLGVSQSRIAAIERNPAAVSVQQIFDLLHLLDAELYLRERPPPLPKGQEW